jgi:hypothetical protein
MMLPCLQQLVLLHREVVRRLLHPVLLKLAQALQLLVQELVVELMSQLELARLVVQVRPLVQKALLQLLQLPVLMAQLLEVQLLEAQPVQKSEMLLTLVLVEFHLLVRLRQALKLLKALKALKSLKSLTPVMLVSKS